MIGHTAEDRLALVFGAIVVALFIQSCTEVVPTDKGIVIVYSGCQKTAKDGGR